MIGKFVLGLNTKFHKQNIENWLTFRWASAANPLLVARLDAIFQFLKKPVWTTTYKKKTRIVHTGRSSLLHTTRAAKLKAIWNSRSLFGAGFVCLFRAFLSGRKGQPVYDFDDESTRKPSGKQPNNLPEIVPPWLWYTNELADRHS